MASATDSQRLSKAIVSFCLQGSFPEDISKIPPVSGTDLNPTIEALASSKNQLEADIQTINQETLGNVSSWVSNTKKLQDDMIRSKSMANDILWQAEAPQASGQAVQDAEAKADFLCREVQYAQQLHEVLASLCRISRLLSDVERANEEGRALESLRLLEQAWDALNNVGALFDRQWKSLISFDVEAGKFAVYSIVDGGTISLDQAAMGFKAFKEMDERMEQFWRSLDAAIITPRMDKSKTALQAIETEADELRLGDETPESIDALVSDMRRVFTFLAEKLSPDLLKSLSGIVMAEFVPKFIQQWLNPAVPSSLAGLPGFEEMIRLVDGFCTFLTDKGYTDFDELKDWATKAPTIWLDKCRESALSEVRTRLTQGLGASKMVEKVERQMVSLTEGKELATTGAGAAADKDDWGADWGDAWDDDADEGPVPQESSPRPAETRTGQKSEDDGADAWGWDEDATGQTATVKSEATAQAEDDSAEAWGWGEEDAGVKSTTAGEETGAASVPRRERKTRELVLRETYHISSMPEPVLELISAIFEDAATVTKEGGEHELVASTGPGLFSIPTLVLALYRAMAPHYYSLDAGGNMFLYNDAMYMAEKLGSISTAWRQREDLTLRARSMLRLEGEMETLRSFANRSYGNEMNVQKTVLQDLLGGTQSLMQQEDMEAAVASGTAWIRTLASTWEPILARSVWSQAMGSLADSLARRLLMDVLDMSSIGQEEAYRIAKLIASASELDDLFLPSKLGVAAEAKADEIPTTAQYAPHWLRLQYLGEVLQSNLNEVRYLWCESELSLYFSADEVVDLIEASFEDNARTRETIREIRAKPQPVAG
ncbi:is centromere binding protein at prophase [Ophiocordyceps camponoti-floridani]|uniref:Is centromere binding protein at prophase n=1 Tax=Ophiocordyceps camponoti-floridani TaxID=2030778 RepID=A0A8H4Q8G8_9HYPO|nr:is centromere binding protein at prophase [Ophiocordyceps camponoti-floridani]